MTWATHECSGEDQKVMLQKFAGGMQTQKKRKKGVKHKVFPKAFPTDGVQLLKVTLDQQNLHPVPSLLLSANGQNTALR